MDSIELNKSPKNARLIHDILTFKQQEKPGFIEHMSKESCIQDFFSDSVLNDNSEKENRMFQYLNDRKKASIFVSGKHSLSSPEGLKKVRGKYNKIFHMINHMMDIYDLTPILVVYSDSNMLFFDMILRYYFSEKSYCVVGENNKNKNLDKDIVIAGENSICNNNLTERLLNKRFKTIVNVCNSEKHTKRLKSILWCPENLYTIIDDGKHKYSAALHGVLNNVKKQKISTIDKGNITELIKDFYSLSHNVNYYYDIRTSVKNTYGHHHYFFHEESLDTYLLEKLKNCYNKEQAEKFLELFIKIYFNIFLY